MQNYRITETILRLIIFTFTLLSPFFLSAQHDSDSLRNILIIWSLPDETTPVYTKEDTLTNMFQIFKIFEKKSISVSHLGNIGSANISNIFTDRFDEYKTDFAFNLPYKIYLSEPDGINFYNTRRPYTNIFYSTGTKIQDEQTIDFTHTQNPTPLLNFAANYKFVGSKGEYTNQESKLNSIVLTSNYTKKHYFLNAAFCYNSFKLQDNGGLIDTGTVDINSLEPNLSNAGTIMQNKHFFVNHRYKFGNFKDKKINDTIIKELIPFISFNHNFDYKKQHRVYKDEESSENGYYQNFYHGTNETYDSLSYNAIINMISIISENKFTERYGFGINFSITNTFKSYYNFKDYILLSEENNYIDNKISASAFTSVKNILLKTFGNYYFSGYRKGDFRAGIFLTKILNKETGNNLSLLLKYTKQKPDYYCQTFYSNHYKWENELDNKKTADASLKINIPSAFFNIKGDIVLLQNYIYYGAISKPEQYDKKLFVYSAKISKIFNLGRLHSNSKIIWQRTNNINIINLPEFAIFQSFYVTLNYKNHLTVDLGFDLYYSTEYKALSFNPAVGHFYFENTNLTGNYPHGSIFINGKVKRNVTMFLKYEHINSNMFIQIYSTVNHYPINNRMFKFGIRWTFTN